MHLEIIADTGNSFQKEEKSFIAGLKDWAENLIIEVLTLKGGQK